LINTTFDIHLYTFFFAEYTSARSPMEYCHGIESPPKYLISINENRMWKINKNPNYIKPSFSIHQVPNDQFASSSGTGKQLRDFDLNQIPSDEDE